MLAGLPDIAMFSIMTRKANLYFNFTIVTFLAFGVLLTLIRLRNAPVGTLANRWRRPVTMALAIQLILCVPFGLWDLHQIWVKGNAGGWGLPSQPVSASDAEAAWRMVDLSCSVTVSNSLLQRFYRAPFWFQSHNIGSARFIVVTDRSLLNLPASRQDDWVSAFFAAQARQLDLVGRSGPVAVWRDRNAPCLPW